MKKYWKIDYRGVMPSIQGHRFHPNLFYATEEEMNDILRKIGGREDEFKVIGIHSFETYADYEKIYRIHKPIEEEEREEIYVPQEVRTLEERRKAREKYQ